MECDSSLHVHSGDDIKTRIMRSRLFYFRKIIATQVTETYREFQDRHKMCHTVKTFRNFGQQRERLTHYLTPLKLLSPPYQRICPPWHPSLVGGILFFVVARIDPSPGQSLLSPIPSWEWGEKSYLKALTIFLIVALLFLLLTPAGKWCVTVKPLSVRN